MKTIVLSVFLCIGLSFNLFSQNITYKNILGEWEASGEKQSGDISFNFANDSVVYFSVDKTATHRATYTMDKVTHLFKVTILTINSNGTAAKKIMLIKYIDPQTLKMQQLNTNAFKWNNKETRSNTGMLKKTN